MRFVVYVDVDLDDSAKDLKLLIEEALRDYGYSVTATLYPDEDIN